MKKDIVKGIIGSIIFATIGSIPWIAYYYIYDRPMFIYGLFIPFGAYNGYKLFHGYKSRYQIVIYTVISIIISAVCCYIVMPILYLIRNENIVSLSNFLDIFNWIEVKYELYHNYLTTIVSIIIGIGIIYIIYIPYLISIKEDYENKHKVFNDIDISINNYYIDQNIVQENFNILKKPIVISAIIVILCLYVFIPKNDYVIKVEDKNIKQISNDWFKYEIPDIYSIYKYGYSNWLITELESEEENKSGITIDYHTIKSEYNSTDKLYDYLFDEMINIAEFENEGAIVKSASKNNYTSNGYQYFEFVIENYRGATHILDYVIDDKFEYCAIIECTCYNDNLKIKEANIQIINTLNISNEDNNTINHMFAFIKNLWENY